MITSKNNCLREVQQNVDSIGFSSRWTFPRYEFLISLSGATCNYSHYSDGACTQASSLRFLLGSINFRSIGSFFESSIGNARNRQQLPRERSSRYPFLLWCSKGKESQWDIPIELSEANSRAAISQFWKNSITTQISCLSHFFTAPEVHGEKRRRKFEKSVWSGRRVVHLVTEEPGISSSRL